MPARFLTLLITWVLLLVLLGAEIWLSFLSFPPWQRVLLMVPAFVMIGLAAFVFMEVRRGPIIVRGFAVAALFWMLVLLGLGSMDPLTRIHYQVSAASPR